MRMIQSLATLLLAILLPHVGDAATLRQVQAIPLDGVEGRIDHLAVDLKANRLYVAGLGNNSVEVIDVQAGKRVESLRGMKEPQGICVIPESGKVIVASGQDGKCRIYDRSLRLLGVIDQLDDADNVRYDPRAKLVYVGYGGGALAIIDPEKMNKLADIKLDGHPESFQLEANGRRIFVNVPTTHQIVVVDRERRAVVGKWPVKEGEANFPMALDEANHRLFVACRKPAKMLVLDTETGKVVASVDCCGDADDLFYDVANKRVYLSGGEGCIDVLAQAAADQYGRIDRIGTTAGARTALFVAQTGKLYVAVPHRGSQKAEILVFQVSGARPAD